MTTRQSIGRRRADLIARVRAAARQEQFLEVVSAEEARARFERISICRRWRPRRVPLGRGARPRAGARRRGRDRRAAVRPRQCRWLRAARRRHRGRERQRAAPLPLNGEVIVCGHAPALEVAPGSATTIATGGVVPRGADAVVMIEHTELVEGGRAGHRSAPRRRARPVHLLCRLRHRARRDGAAARRAHRLARDRHAGGLRPRRSRCGAAAESGGALDRRRTGRAGRAARSRRGSTTATAPSSPRRSRKRAASRCRSAPFPTTRWRSNLPCARRSTLATWSCCRAAPRRARAISRTASCRSSADPASSCMASRSSRASRFVSP